MFSYYELSEDDPTAQLSCGPIKGQNLNHVLSLDLPSSFIFTVNSKRYHQLGICTGDFVVVRRDLIPDSGQLVLVKIHGKFVLRTFGYAGAAPYVGSNSGSGSESGPEPERSAASADADAVAVGTVPEYVHYGPDGTPDFELFGVVAAVFRKLGRARPRPN